MDDFEFEKVIEALRANAEALGRVSVDLGGGKGKSSKSSKYASAKLSDDLSRKSKRLSDSFSKTDVAMKALNTSADDLTSGLKRMLKEGVLGFLGGAVVVDIFEYGEDLAKTYRKLSDIGETFGGNMIEMAAQAAAAGLPLNEFADMLERNSIAAAQLAHSSNTANATFGSLQKGVRDNLKQFGFFGMSLAEVSDVTGDYAETLRQSGSATFGNSKAMTEQVEQFAKDIGDWGYVTGRDRKQILDDANDVLRNTLLNAVPLSEAQQKAMATVAVALSSFPSGKEVADGVADTVAALSSGTGAYMTDLGKQLNDSGAAPLLGALNDLGEKVRNGTENAGDATADFIRQSQNFYKTNGDQLRVLAIGGNAEAKQTLAMLEQFNNIDLQDLKRKMKDAETQKRLTKNFNLFEDFLNKMLGDFKNPIFDSLSTFGDNWNPDSVFKNLDDFATKAGTLIGNAFKYLIDTNGFATDIKPLSDVIMPYFKEFADFITSKDFVKDLSTFGLGVVSVFKWVYHFFKDDIIPFFAKILIPVLSGIGTVLGKVDSVIQRFATSLGIDSPMSKAIGFLVTGLTAVAAYFTAKSFLSRMLGTLTGRVDIKAAVVNVNGGNGPGGGGGGFFDYIKKKLLGGGAAAEAEAVAGEAGVAGEAAVGAETVAAGGAAVAAGTAAAPVLLGVAGAAAAAAAVAYGLKYVSDKFDKTTGLDTYVKDHHLANANSRSGRTAQTTAQTTVPSQPDGIFRSPTSDDYAVNEAYRDTARYQVKDYLDNMGLNDSIKGPNGQRQSLSQILAKAGNGGAAFGDLGADELTGKSLDAIRQGKLPAVPNDPTKLQKMFDEELAKEPALEKGVEKTAGNTQEHIKMLKELNDNILKLVAIQAQANAMNITLQKKQLSATTRNN